MPRELLTTQIPHELPAAEVQVQVTTCENRLEILISPGYKTTSWDAWILQGKLATWLQSRIDSKKEGGHNPPNSFL
jgi:hypothetical protein